MTTFITEEREAAPHVREPEPLALWADVGIGCSVYYHRSATDSVTDICHPGHFNFMREHFLSGRDKRIIHYIIAHLGEIADGMIEARLHVTHCPVSRDEDVTVALSDKVVYAAVTN